MYSDCIEYIFKWTIHINMISMYYARPGLPQSLPAGLVFDTFALLAISIKAV